MAENRWSGKMEAKALSLMDITNDFKPSYTEIPPTWQRMGIRGFVGKQGQGFTIAYWLMGDGVTVGFFTDKIAKTEDGKYCIESFHFQRQVLRAGEYAKK